MAFPFIYILGIAHALTRCHFFIVVRGLFINDFGINYNKISISNWFQYAEWKFYRCVIVHRGFIDK